jgi:hypothetical protein
LSVYIEFCETTFDSTKVKEAMQKKGKKHLPSLGIMYIELYRLEKINNDDPERD